MNLPSESLAELERDLGFIVTQDLETGTFKRVFAFGKGATQDATPYEYILYCHLAQHAESVWRIRELFGSPPDPEAAVLAEQFIKVVPAEPEAFAVKVYEREILRFTDQEDALAFADRLKVPLRESLDGYATMREAHRIAKTDKPH